MRAEKSQNGVIAEIAREALASSGLPVCQACTANLDAPDPVATTLGDVHLDFDELVAAAKQDYRTSTTELFTDSAMRFEVAAARAEAFLWCETKLRNMADVRKNSEAVVLCEAADAIAARANPKT